MHALIAAAFILFTNTFANADIRNESISVISALRNTEIAKKMPDEMHSIDVTFKTAEQYFQRSDFQSAERYYLLTIQKARVLANIQFDRPAEASAYTNEQLQESQPSPASSVDNNKATRLHHAATAESVSENQTVAPTNVQPLTMQPLETISPTASGQTSSEDDSDYSPSYVSSEDIIGNLNTYIVRKNDSLRLVAAKLGVSRQHLSQVNHLDPKAYLKIGQRLKYNNRKIVPHRMKNGIVINIPDRTLYYFKQGKLAVSMPVALGVANKNEKHDWKTPTGKFKVTAKQKDPTWHVPFSIQSEMEDDGKEVVTSVPPGPGNPLGKYAIKTSLPGILIHSTTKPGSIYSFASHGCIRVYPEHMEGLFKEIRINTPGEIIYRPVKLAVTEEGRIFMEVHQDAYGKNTGLYSEARRLIEKQNLSDRVDWIKVKSMIKLKSGIAEDITL